MFIYLVGWNTDQKMILSKTDLPWFEVEEGIQRFRKIVMLECICNLRPTYSPWEARKHTFYHDCEKFMRGGPSLKSSVIAYFCRPDLTVGTTGTELGNLNESGVIEFQSVKGQVMALNHQRQGGGSYCNGHQSQSSNQNSLTHTDL